MAGFPPKSGVSGKRSVTIPFPAKGYHLFSSKPARKCNSVGNTGVHKLGGKRLSAQEATIAVALKTLRIL